MDQAGAIVCISLKVVNVPNFFASINPDSIPLIDRVLSWVDRFLWTHYRYFHSLEAHIVLDDNDTSAFRIFSQPMALPFSHTWTFIPKHTILPITVDNVASDPGSILPSYSFPDLRL